MKTVTAFLFAVILLTLQSQQKYAFIYLQNTAPSASAGDFWYSPVTSTLKLATSSGAAWVTINTGSNSGGGVPTGAIVLIASGTCPSGYAEVSGLNGKFPLGTVAANNNIGTTGGLDNITPAGTIASQAFTGTQANLTHAGSAVADHNYTPAGSNSVPTFTGSALGTHQHGVGTLATSSHVGTAVADHTSHTHTDTAAGTNSIPVFVGIALAAHAHELPWQIPSTTTIRQIAIAIFGTGTSRVATAVSAAGTANTTSAAVALSQSVSAGTPSGTVSAPTFTGSSVVTSGPSAVLTHAVTQPSDHTLSGSVAAISAGTPAGMVTAPTFAGTLASLPHNVTQPNTHVYTPTGIVSTGTFTGTQFDNRPSFVRIIACSKS